ncbi:MAG: hypothetical protein ACT4PL_04820, partial [Phycisphaerales bacterium]
MLNAMLAESSLQTASPFWLYSIFLLMVFCAIGIDLFVLNRRQAVMSMRSAVTWTMIWMGLALVFNV